MSECHEQKKRAIYNETEERKRMKKINEHKHISTKRIFSHFFHNYTLFDFYLCFISDVQPFFGDP